MLLHIYDLATGVFTGASLDGCPEFIAANTPPGHGAMPGVVDPAGQRVDTAAGQVIDYQPPAPPDDAMRTWAWHAGTKRWQPTPTTAAIAAAARQQRNQLLAACDWVTARAVEQATPVPTAWSVYRQALRDISTQASWPTDITWPTPP